MKLLFNGIQPGDGGFSLFSEVEKIIQFFFLLKPKNVGAAPLVFNVMYPVQYSKTKN